MNEPLEHTFTGLLERVVASVQPPPGEPFAIFGHSLGAIIAFELAVRLEQRGRHPLAVFVSAARAPSARDPARYDGLETDDELRAELSRLDGTPADVLADPELMAMTLPVLRADFRVASSYIGVRGSRVGAPLVALGGAEDASTRQGFSEWRDHAAADYAQHTLPGGHFYIRSSMAELLQLIEERLSLRQHADCATSRPELVAARSTARG
jgi:surfactin synthase thioesterase subunit